MPDIRLGDFHANINNWTLARCSATMVDTVAGRHAHPKRLSNVLA